MRFNLRGQSSSRWLTAVGTLTAGLFLAYLIALPPHLVHHLFDEDHGRPACSHLAQSQQTPELQPDPPTLIAPILIETLHALIPESSLPSADLVVGHSRAPPRSVSSV